MLNVLHSLFCAIQVIFFVKLLSSLEISCSKMKVFFFFCVTCSKFVFFCSKSHTFLLQILLQLLFWLFFCSKSQIFLLRKLLQFLFWLLHPWHRRVAAIHASDRGRAHHILDACCKALWRLVSENRSLSAAGVRSFHLPWCVPCFWSSMELRIL